MASILYEDKQNLVNNKWLSHGRHMHFNDILDVKGLHLIIPPMAVTSCDLKKRQPSRFDGLAQQ